MEEDDLDGIPLPSQRSSTSQRSGRKRPGRRKPVHVMPAVLDLDDLGLSSEVEVSSEKFERESSFETEIIKFLDESLDNLRQEFLYEFERLVMSVFSFEDIIDNFSDSLTKKIAEAVVTTESESNLSLKDLNRGVAEQFEILSLPHYEASDERNKRIDSGDVELANRKFLDKAGKTLEMLTLERSELAAARDIESYQAINSLRSVSMLGDLEAAEKGIEIQAEFIEQKLEQLEKQQEKFRKEELQLLGDFDGGLDFVSLKRAISELPTQINRSRIVETRKKAERFVRYLDDLLTTITPMATRIQVAYDQICRVVGSSFSQQRVAPTVDPVMEESPRPVRMYYPRPMEIDHDGLLNAVRARLDNLQRERQEAARAIAALK